MLYAKYAFKFSDQPILERDTVTARHDENLPDLVKEIRSQLALSQEDLARQLGISFATVNRWENGQVKPSKLARAQFDKYCVKMIRQGKLQLPGDSI